MKRWQKNKPLICSLVIDSWASNKKIHTPTNKYCKQRCGNMNTRMIYVPYRIIKKIKEICTNIDRHIKNIYKETVTDFFTSLNDHKKKIRMDTNRYIIHRHFLLSTIMDLNTILMKHKAKFMLSSDMYEDICNKIKSQ